MTRPIQPYLVLGEPEQIGKLPSAPTPPPRPGAPPKN
jgi:hypothetical protein